MENFPIFREISGICSDGGPKRYTAVSIFERILMKYAIERTAKVVHIDKSW